MTGTELIVATPWAIFGLSLTAVWLRLRRPGRLRRHGWMHSIYRMHSVYRMHRRTARWSAKDRQVTERSGPEPTGEQPGSDSRAARPL